MFQNFPKEKRQSIAIFVVLAIIVIVNTVVMIFVGFKILDMEDLDLNSANNEKNELGKPRDLNLLKKEFSELEKSAKQSKDSSQSKEPRQKEFADTKSNTGKNTKKSNETLP